MISRRGLLAGIFAAGAAPWVVRAGVLMPVNAGYIRVPGYERFYESKNKGDTAIFRRFCHGPNGEITYVDMPLSRDEFGQYAPRELGPNVIKPIDGSYILLIHPDWIGPISAT